MEQNYDLAKDEFIDYYYERLDLFKRVAEFYQSLLHSLLDSFQVDSISARVKSLNSSLDKFNTKYRTEAESSGESYKIQNFITDLVGTRIVCLYKEDVAKIQNEISQNFEIINVTDKIAMVESTEDQFRYKSLHIDCKINQERRVLPEYKAIADQPVEIQIRTIIQDAWSALDHKIKYKKQIKPSLRRRINCLSALFEVADNEFQQIQKESNDSTDETNAQIEGVGHPKAINTINLQEFLGFCAEKFPFYNFFVSRASEFVHSINESSCEFSLQDLQEAWNEFSGKVEEYKSSWVFGSMNPYTTLRHVLYLKNKDTFKNILFPSQRNHFENWVSERRP